MRGTAIRASLTYREEKKKSQFIKDKLGVLVSNEYDSMASERKCEGLVALCV